MKKWILTALLISLSVFYNNSFAGNFTDNGNGTVTDNKTHFIWQQQQGREMNWKGAIAYCQDLALGGNKDWRLPSKKELKSLVDFTRYRPSIDTTYFPNTNASNYWSATSNRYQASHAWHVNVFNGSVYISPKSSTYYVKCVREEEKSE